VWWAVVAAAVPGAVPAPPGCGLYLPVAEPLLLVGEERHRGACPALAWLCSCPCPWSGRGGFSLLPPQEAEPLRPRVGAAVGRLARRRAAAVRLDVVLPPHRAEGASPGAGAGRVGRGAGRQGVQAAAAGPGRGQVGRPWDVLAWVRLAAVAAAGPGQGPVGRPPGAVVLVSPAAAEVAVGRPGAGPPGDAGRHHRHLAFSSYHPRAAAGWSTRRDGPGQCVRWVARGA